MCRRGVGDRRSSDREAAPPSMTPFLLLRCPFPPLLFKPRSVLVLNECGFKTAPGRDGPQASPKLGD